ncbi:hypothetical protein B5X24_HaOG212775, partial [Helicoverpa armigera]
MYLVSEGLLSWDSGEHQVDLEKELSTLTAQAPEGEEARYGERLIQFASENLVTEILIHPQMNTLMQCMRNLLSSFTRHRHLVHAGYTFAGNGSWIMQDGTFSLADFTDAYQENEVQRVIRAYENSISIDVHCSTSGGGEWAKLPEMPFVKYCKIRVNPTDILDSGSQAIKDFIAYLDPYIVPASLDQLLVSSDVVGNIRFSHPTLYVFPGGQGDAALFGINGFNMLVDGGFSRKACWWDFARHLDRLDAVLFTRINNCSMSGMASVLRRKASATVYPQIGHFFCNLEERRALASPDGDKDSDPLLVSLLQEGSDMMADLRHINLKPQHCYRSPEPINLYHKVGHGTLDMYVLNPSKDSKYVREFLKRWHNSEQKLFEGASVSGQFNFPIPNLVSICALLVWRPANPDDTITRIMFPGSTPQHKIFEGLEKLKHLEFLQHPTCTGRQMAPTTPPATTTATTVTTTKTSTKTTVKPSKDRSIISDKTKEDKIVEPEPPPKDLKEGETKNIIDNKLLSELVDEEDKIESVLHDAITARIETKLDDKIAQYESTVIDGLPKKREVKKKAVDKKTKRVDKTDEVKDTVVKADTKKVDAEPKAKLEKKTKVDTRKSEMTSSMSRTKLSHRTTRAVSERKTVASSDKKAAADDKKSPPTTPKKTLEARPTPSVPAIKDKIKAKPRRLSPGSTPAKSTKEAKNRMVVESKYKQSSPKRDVAAKSTEKKETKAKREPISRRPRPLSSPVKGLKAMKSPTKSVKSVKADSSKLKGLQRVNYEDILKDAKKSDEDTSKSLDDIKQQELDEREEQEIVREIEAVFNRDSEAEEKIEFVGRSDIEKITCLLDDTKTETTADGEFEEEYLIIEKEEVEQYTEDSVLDREDSHDHEEELQKHAKDKEESEKKKDVTILEKDKPDETQIMTEAVIETEVKQIESKEHSVSVEEKQDISSEKKTSDSKSIPKPKDSLEMQVQESQPDEKISTTIESGATTAPTLPEDERITLDDIKEDQQVEEKHIQEETKEVVPPQSLVDTTKPLSLEKSPKLESVPVPIREIVKTPDEVADLPLHEEVDYRTYVEKKTPEEEPFKRKVEDIKVPKDLPLSDVEGTFKGTKAVQEDVVVKTVQSASHAELVTVTPGSAPESPMYHEQMKVSAVPDKDLQPVKEYDDGEYDYGQYTEKLRETHITTLDSPIKDDIIVIEEIPCMPEKIPSIPEDVEKEIEEARKLEMADKPPLSPKEVEKIVADVAEVLKSDKSLDEIMAEKSPLLSKSPEAFPSMDKTVSVIEATKMLLSSEQEIKHDLRDEVKDTKALDAKPIHEITDTIQKEVSPVRSITSEDVSETSDKTVLSEGKRVKRELLEEKIKDKVDDIKESLDEPKTTSVDITDHAIVDKKDQIDDHILQKHPVEKVDIEEIKPQRRVSTTLESAKTLEKLEEKIADLKRKEEEKIQDKIEMTETKVSEKSDRLEKEPVIPVKQLSPEKELKEETSKEKPVIEEKESIPDREIPKKTLLQKAETKVEKVAGKVSAFKDEVFGFFGKKTDKKEPSPDKDTESKKKITPEKEIIPVEIKETVMKPAVDDVKKEKPEVSIFEEMKEQDNDIIEKVDQEQLASPSVPEDKFPSLIYDEDQELDIEERLIGFEPTGKPEVVTSTESTIITEKGVMVTRKSTITTIVQEYSNVTKTILRYKTTVLTIENDELPDGTKLERTYRKVSLAHERPKISPTKSDKEMPSSIKHEKKEVSDKPVTPVKSDEALSADAKPLSETTLEEKPSLIYDEDQELEIEERLMGFEPTKEREEITTTEVQSVTEKGILIQRKLIVTTIVQEYTNVTKTMFRYKTTILTFEEDELPDGNKISRTIRKVSLAYEKPKLKHEDETGAGEDRKSLSPEKDISSPIKDDELSPTSIKTAEPEEKVSSPQVSEEGEIPVLISDQAQELEIEEMLKEYTPLGKEEEHTKSKTEMVTHMGVITHRTSIITTTIQSYKHIVTNFVKYKICIVANECDEHQDGSRYTRVMRQMKLVDKRPDPIPFEFEVRLPLPEEEAVRTQKLIKLEKISDHEKLDDEPEKEKDDFDGEKPKTVVESDKPIHASQSLEIKKPDGKTPMLICDEAQELEINERLKEFTPLGKAEEHTTSKVETVTFKGFITQRESLITTVIQEYKHVTKKVVRYRICIMTIEEDKLPDGSIYSRVIRQMKLVDKKPYPIPFEFEDKLPIPEDETSPKMKSDRPLQLDDKLLTQVKYDKEAPILVDGRALIEPDDVKSKVKLDEKTPSPIYLDDKAASPIKRDEKESTDLMVDEKKPSPVKTDEKAPSPVKPHEKEPSPSKLDDKVPSPVELDEKAPSPVKEDERKLSAISLDEKAPSPVKSEDKAPSPVKPDDKAPSPVKTDEKEPSPIKPDEKAPSPVKPDEKTPSPVKHDEKEPSSVKLDEKAPSPVELREKAPSPVKEDERKLSAISLDEKAPSPIKSEDKAPSLVKPDEKAPSPVKPDEKAPSPVKPDEKAPSPVKPDEKEPSPSKLDEKTPSPVELDEKAPSPVKEDERKLSAISLDEKAPSP